MKNPAGSWLLRSDRCASTGIETTHAHANFRA